MMIQKFDQKKVRKKCWKKATISKSEFFQPKQPKTHHILSFFLTFFNSNFDQQRNIKKVHVDFLDHLRLWRWVGAQTRCLTLSNVNCLDHLRLWRWGGQTRFRNSGEPMCHSFVPFHLIPKRRERKQLRRERRGKQ